MKGILNSKLDASWTLELGIQDRLGLLKLGLTITFDLDALAQLETTIAQKGNISFDSKITF